MFTASNVIDHVQLFMSSPEMRLLMTTEEESCLCRENGASDGREYYGYCLLRYVAVIPTFLLSHLSPSSDCDAIYSGRRAETFLLNLLPAPLG
jgi:hypothetical protein